mmetsp:Transcript_27198/g.108903  ORF Transcript_27198/g.108903 Transcript_27198/m.108903 type:complete len:235 (+) Transcript_27198:1550-2254(+)
MQGERGPSPADHHLRRRRRRRVKEARVCATTRYKEGEWRSSSLIARGTPTVSLLTLRDARDDVVDAEDERGRLDGGLEHLDLDGERVPDGALVEVLLRRRAQLGAHVDELPRRAVDAPAEALGRVEVLRLELREHADDFGAAVLGEGPRHDFHRSRDGHDRKLQDPDRGVRRFRRQRAVQRHLGRAAAGEQFGLQHDVLDDLHGVLQVPFDFVEHVLGAAAQQNRARLGVFAVI